MTRETTAMVTVTGGGLAADVYTNPTPDKLQEEEEAAVMRRGGEGEGHGGVTAIVRGAWYTLTLTLILPSLLKILSLLSLLHEHLHDMYI